MAAAETAGSSTSVGMTILSLGWGVSRFICCGYHRIVIPTVVEGPAVSLPRSWVLAQIDCFFSVNHRTRLPTGGWGVTTLPSRQLCLDAPRTSVHGLTNAGRSPIKGLSFLFSVTTKDRVLHPSRFLRRVEHHGSASEDLPRRFCLSHPSQRARRMGHPVFGGRRWRKRHSFEPHPS